MIHTGVTSPTAMRGVRSSALLGLALLTACGGGGTATGGAPTLTPTPSPSASTPTPSTMLLGPAIAVDQFGYIPGHQKIAVIRDPQTGFDASDALTPGATYEVVNVATNAVVYSGSPTAWNNGAEDSSSGDKVWHFDFSSVTANGEYFVRDQQRREASPRFKIGADVYAPVL